MGQSTPILRPSTEHLGPNRFLIGQDDEGHWIARDGRGLTGGLFVTKNAAIDFARSESDRGAGSIVLLPGSVKLTLAGALPRL